MFVLKRKAGESFTIDGQIKITILNKNGTARIGIEAPNDVLIIRDNNNEEKNLSSSN